MSSGADFSYTCLSSADEACAETCVSLEACEECGCAVLPTDVHEGPWGEVVDVLFCLAPIIFLVVVTVKPNAMPTTQSLPIAAFLMFLVRLAYLGSDPLLTCSSVVLGLLEAWTPLSIMAGAIALFETMEVTLCMPFIMREIKALTAGHAVAELLLIFCFAYTIEGASGFGTPAALSAPMLVQCGHPALESIIIMLVFNTFATVWGAVGTPLWFGFGSIMPDLSDDDLVEVSQKAAVALAVAAFILVPWVLTVLVPWKTVMANIAFIYLSLLSCIGPSVIIAFFNVEFPSLMGGLAGCAFTALFIKFKVGLKPYEKSEHEPEVEAETESPKTHQPDEHDSSEEHAASNDEADMEALPSQASTAGHSDDNMDSADEVADAESPADVAPDAAAEADRILGPRKSMSEGYLREAFFRTFPIWGVVLLLIFTRIEQVQIKEQLTRRDPYFDIDFGSLGQFRMSASLVLQLQNILTYPKLNWKYELLYIPFLVPFILISFATTIIFRKDLKCRRRDIALTVGRRLKNPMIALLGALVLVQLVIRTGNEAPAKIIGTNLADWFQEGFVVLSPLLGALGSFFSGSTTVSNLTFGEIQSIAAQSIGTSSTTMLALQAVGASAGNGICLNNIIAVCAVVGLTSVGEGKILLKTVRFVLANTTIATIVMLAFYFRF